MTRPGEDFPPPHGDPAVASQAGEAVAVIMRVHNLGNREEQPEFCGDKGCET